MGKFRETANKLLPVSSHNYLLSKFYIHAQRTKISATTRDEDVLNVNNL